MNNEFERCRCDDGENLLSDEDVVESALKLARAFYILQGHEVMQGFKFYESQHPQELMCWEMSRVAFLELRKTDINDALDNI